MKGLVKYCYIGSFMSVMSHSCFLPRKPCRGLTSSDALFFILKSLNMMKPDWQRVNIFNGLWFSSGLWKYHWKTNMLGEDCGSHSTDTNQEMNRRQRWHGEWIILARISEFICPKSALEHLGSEDSEEKEEESRHNEGN